MKKSDLKTGMYVRHRNGDVSLVMRDHWHKETFESILQNDYGFHRFSEMNNDFTFSKHNEFDIMEVGWCGKGQGMFSDGKIRMLDKIWERTKENTYEIDGVEYSETTLKNLIKKATK